MFLEQRKQQQQEIDQVEPVDLPKKKHGYLHLPLVIPWLSQLNLESFL